ncbi:MAG: UDP-N-acetylmuramoyl-L-alanine--D-glutamate ligase [Planctomycetota bacterium]|jgi:UDP-N-acetylmuramoylalanine--D-glutamate ligase|nr:UDP-N-acetylmuramoyl-L-alanine--D-glutamate ligase [Planctomycetota bacterium]
MTQDTPTFRERLRGFRRVTVMGLGLFGGGVGAACYFSDLGARLVVTDLAPAEKLGASLARLEGRDIEFRLGGHRMRDFTGTDLVVANQVVRPDNRYLAAARANGIPVLTETGIALALNRSPWAAVTGSAGKSTTAALLAAMLVRHDPNTMFGGNIGGDLITRIETQPAASPVVVELSSFQLIHIGHALLAGDIAPPAAAAVTNLSPNHLDWHLDAEEYYQCKRKLILAQRPGGAAVLNVDDPLLAGWAREAPGRVIRCALADPGGDDACFVDGGRIALRLSGSAAAEIPLGILRPRGRHNIVNAVQATAAAFAVTGDAKPVADGLAAFPGLPHRMETAATAAGRTFVNDSKCTTPEAAILALEAVEEAKVLIAGGYDKRAPFDELGRAVQKRAHGLVLIGAAAGRLRRAVLDAEADRDPGLGKLGIIDAGGDFGKAVREAFRLCPVGGVVLLSPACASWDMFRNYEERGEKFRALAVGLGR